VDDLSGIVEDVKRDDVFVGHPHHRVDLIGGQRRGRRVQRAARLVDELAARLVGFAGGTAAGNQERRK